MSNCNHTLLEKEEACNAGACPVCQNWSIRILEEIKKKLEYARGCSDHSCCINPPTTGGMGTNGGCRCLPDSSVRNAFRILREALKQIK